MVRKDKVIEFTQSHASVLSVLRELRATNEDEGGVSSASIQNRLGFAWQTVNKIVEDLVDANMLINTTTGKREKYTLNPDFGLFLGIDIGARGIKPYFLNFDYSVCEREELGIKVPNNDIDAERWSLEDITTQLTVKNALLDYISTANSTGANRKSKRILSIGVSWSGAIVPGTNRLLISGGGSIDIDSIFNDIKEAVDEILNDQNTRFPNNIIGFKDNPFIALKAIPGSMAGVIAEKYLGGMGGYRPRPEKNIVYISLRTKVSAGFFLNGQLYQGNSYTAGRFGNILVRHYEATPSSFHISPANEDLVNTNSNQDIELYDEDPNTRSSFCLNQNPVIRLKETISSAAFEMAIKQRTQKPLSPNNVQLEIENFVLANSSEAARNEFQKYCQLYADFGRYLGCGLATIVDLFDPGLIILGGGLSKAYSLFKNTMWKEFREIVGDSVADKTIIEQSAMPTAGQAYGAAIIASQEWEYRLYRIGS